MKLTARHSTKRGKLVGLLLITSLLYLAYRHWSHFVTVGSIQLYIYTNWLYIISFLIMAVVIILAMKEKPHIDTGDVSKSLRVVAVVPAYNEDPQLLRECLESLLNQSRPVQEIYVIDDGSDKSDYSEIHLWFDDLAKKINVKAQWIRTENMGKRHAQLRAFRESNDAEIFLTVDSDSVLDGFALEELMKPFANPDIKSVAGVVLARNNQTNLLARITDLLFVTGQLIDRSMMSSLGSVLVNSGGLAAYRADIVRENLDIYMNEKFFGHNIEFSDDSMLTLFALQNGKTVQQSSAFVFTMMPEKFSHHVRQQIRWMKGSFIRSWWRIKYLPVASYGFARQATAWTQFMMNGAILVFILISLPRVRTEFLVYVALIPVLIGYMQSLRYLSVVRSNESFYSQFVTYLLTPVAILWSYIVLRPIRLYAVATCLKNKWGTRDSIEVTLTDQSKLNIIGNLLKYRKYRIYRQTRYEYLAKQVKSLNLDRNDAETKWQSIYSEMDDTMKHSLWLDYELVQIRKANLGKGYLTLPYRRMPILHKVQIDLKPVGIAAQ